MSMPVSSPCAPAAGWRLMAAKPLISRSSSASSHMQLEAALREGVGVERMRVGEPGQAGGLTR